ncbi:MAG TPA: hypothetical protein VGA13_08110 [Acidimicrobiales bacterium]
MRSTIRVAALTIATMAVTSCTDRVGEGLPDLDAVDPAVLAIDVTVEVGPDGCTPPDLGVPPGTTVGFTAVTDDVRVRATDAGPDADAAPVFDTGPMLADETSEWWLPEPMSGLLICEGTDATSTGTIEVSEEAGS